MGTPTTIVIPTIGRPSLHQLLAALTDDGACDAPIIVVDDRPAASAAAAELADLPPGNIQVIASGGRGPAAARNVGWRASRTRWVTFLDDDVLPQAQWPALLRRDIAEAAPDVVGVQGNVSVPLPSDRRPTDWERVTAGLETARWITADMTYRRRSLAAVGGFDERFPRAFREDADLALRVIAQGGRLVRGRRGVIHPVRPVDDWVSVRVQAGNADDVLMRRLHGPHWRRRAQAPRGRRARHLAVTATGLATFALAVSGRRRAAVLPALAWLVGTAELASARIRPGPRTVAEVRRMVITSLAIPPAAGWHTLRGYRRHRHATAWRGQPELVLFDRDGTLIYDVPYNGDPDRAVPVDDAKRSLDLLRAHGVRVGVVTNQSGVSTGKLTAEQVNATNARVEQLLGPFDVWQVCQHGRSDGCGCRKPEPGMVKAACQELDVDPAWCVLVGDIGSDVAAAQAAGCEAILVPTPMTRPAEVESAPMVEADLDSAVRRILAGAW
ncbi:MAG: HAD-IIIA family hydrolase [Nocardioidaceae bacterium]